MPLGSLDTSRRYDHLAEAQIQEILVASHRLDLCSYTPCSEEKGPFRDNYSAISGLNNKYSHVFTFMFSNMILKNNAWKENTAKLKIVHVSIHM